MPAELKVEQPPHRMSQLTTAELTRYQKELLQAQRGISPDAPVQADLRARLAEVVAEFESRDQLARTVHRRTGL